MNSPLRIAVAVLLTLAGLGAQALFSWEHGLVAGLVAGFVAAALIPSKGACGVRSRSEPPRRSPDTSEDAVR